VWNTYITIFPFQTCHLFGGQWDDACRSVSWIAGNGNSVISRVAATRVTIAHAADRCRKNGWLKLGKPIFAEATDGCLIITSRYVRDTRILSVSFYRGSKHTDLREKDKVWSEASGCERRYWLSPPTCVNTWTLRIATRGHINLINCFNV